MGAIELLLTVVYATALAAAFFMVSIASTHGEFVMGQLIALAAGLSLTVAYLLWIYEDDGPSWRQALLGIGIIGFVGFGTPQFIDWVSAHEKNQHADVTLHLIYKKLPALVLDNLSEQATAKQIKWTAYLWNLGHPDDKKTLPIPIQIFDFLPARASGGPIDLFGNPRVASLVKDGDIIFGSVSAVCIDCSRGHTFVVFFKLGDGGWYAEDTEDNTGGYLMPNNLETRSVADLAHDLASAIPIQNRILIKDLGE
jgi:hypothetical protein